MLFGTPVAETILASVHVRAHQQAEHMGASDLIKALQTALRGGVRPHMAKIPGVGPVGAMLLRMKTPEPELFRSGRQFAAWVGLTPRDHSTAGKTRLGIITRAGDERLRSVLVVGATAVIQQARRTGKASPWLAALLKRKSPKLAAVALANKMARVAWKLMLTGEAYAATPAPAAAGAV